MTSKKGSFVDESPTLFSPADIIGAIATGSIDTQERPWGVMHATHCHTHLYSFIIKLIELNDDARTSLQFHEVKHEVVRIISGDGTIEGTPDVELGRPRPSPWYRIHPGMIHRGVGPLLYVEVTTAEDDDVVRIADDYGRT